MPNRRQAFIWTNDYPIQRRIYPSTDPSNKSHNAWDKYLAMRYFVTEMYTHVHIFVTKWCIVGQETVALWYSCTRSIRRNEYNPSRRPFWVTSSGKLKWFKITDTLSNLIENMYVCCQCCDCWWHSAVRFQWHLQAQWWPSLRPVSIRNRYWNGWVYNFQTHVSNV